jgi:hypothetical protein
VRCGHCGTEVRAGYTTYFRCGAVYGKKFGPLGPLIGAGAICCLVIAIAALYIGAYGPAFGYFVLFCLGWALTRGIVAITPS